MTKLRTKIIVAVLTTTLVVMAVLGFIIGQVFKEFYFEQLTDRMEKEAELVSFTIFSNLITGNYDFIQRQAQQVSDRLDARVTIILRDGTVVGESASDPSLLENHLDRPEIQAVLNGNGSPQIRFSTTVNDDLVYVAVPVFYREEIFGFVRIGMPTVALIAMNHKIWFLLMVSFTLAFIVIVVITSRITNQMMLPVEQATKVAKDLAQGDYKGRVIEGRKDEIGQLSRSINMLAHHLDKLTKGHQIQQERLETLIENMGSGLVLINTRGDITLVNRTFRDIFQEDTEKWLHQLYYEKIEHKEIIKIIQAIFMTEKKQRKEIKISLQFHIRYFDVYGVPIIREDKLRGIVLVFHDITELKSLEQVRKDFVANVSHELKTPITSIKGFSETLLDGAMADPDYLQQFLTIIWKESDRLQTLIDDLLELSRIEQQYFQMNWQTVEMSEIVNDVSLILKPKAEEKEIQLQILEEGNTKFEGDPYRLKQIVINLVSNSLTYTPHRGNITIRLKELKDEVLFEVTDTGIGMNEHELPRIFERFYRIDRARARNSGGTGLGLAIVKHLVEAHHAKIHVSSKVNEGTTFQIIFKRYQA